MRTSIHNTWLLMPHGHFVRTTAATALNRAAWRQLQIANKQCKIMSCDPAIQVSTNNLLINAPIGTRAFYIFVHVSSELIMCDIKIGLMSNKEKTSPSMIPVHLGATGVTAGDIQSKCAQKQHEMCVKNATINSRFNSTIISRVLQRITIGGSNTSTLTFQALYPHQPTQNRRQRHMSQAYLSS